MKASFRIEDDGGEVVFYISGRVLFTVELSPSQSRLYNKDDVVVWRGEHFPELFIVKEINSSFTNMLLTCSPDCVEDDPVILYVGSRFGSNVIDDTDFSKIIPNGLDRREALKKMREIQTLWKKALPMIQNTSKPGLYPVSEEE